METRFSLMSGTLWPHKWCSHEITLTAMLEVWHHGFIFSRSQSVLSEPTREQRKSTGSVHYRQTGSCHSCVRNRASNSRRGASVQPRLINWSIIKLMVKISRFIDNENNKRQPCSDPVKISIWTLCERPGSEYASVRFCHSPPSCEQTAVGGASVGLSFHHFQAGGQAHGFIYRGPGSEHMDQPEN